MNRQTDIDSVDILIVTALPIELEALKSYFDFSVKPSHDTKNIFYMNTNNSYANSIAVVCVRDMGNVPSGITALDAISKLCPSYVIMFGLAGSLDKDEIPIECVTISTDIVYTESGKERQNINRGLLNLINSKEDIIETRQRAFPVSKDLLNKMQHYHEFEYYDADYGVNFGIFAITEKVISNHTGRDRLLEVHPKSITVEMESYGVAYASSFYKRPIQFIAVRGISDYADPEKSDDYRKKCLNNAANFLMGFLKRNQLSVENPAQAEQWSGKLFAIQHLSLNFQQSVTVSAEAFDDDLKDYEVVPLLIDQTDLFNTGSLKNPHQALERQLEHIKNIARLQRETPDSKIAYFGLAHVPLTFHLGHNLKGNEIEKFENFHNSGHWFKLPKDGDVPEVKIDMQQGNIENPTNDVIVRMSVTYPVHMHQLEEIPSSPLAYYHIHHEEVGETIAYTEPSVDAFVNAFAKLRNRIFQEYP